MIYKVRSDWDSVRSEIVKAVGKLRLPTEKIVEILDRLAKFKRRLVTGEWFIDQISAAWPGRDGFATDVSEEINALIFDRALVRTGFVIQIRARKFKMFAAEKLGSGDAFLHNYFSAMVAEMEPHVGRIMSLNEFSALVLACHLRVSKAVEVVPNYDWGLYKFTRVIGDPPANAKIYNSIAAKVKSDRPRLLVFVGRVDGSLCLAPRGYGWINLSEMFGQITDDVGSATLRDARSAIRKHLQVHPLAVIVSEKMLIDGVAKKILDGFGPYMITTLERRADVQSGLDTFDVVTVVDNAA